MDKINKREQLNKLRDEAEQVIENSRCRILICAGTGCLAGGSGEIYKRMCELVASNPNVEVHFGPEIAHGDGPSFCQNKKALSFRIGFSEKIVKILHIFRFLDITVSLIHQMPQIIKAQAAIFIDIIEKLAPDGIFVIDGKLGDLGSVGPFKGHNEPVAQIQKGDALPPDGYRLDVFHNVGDVLLGGDLQLVAGVAVKQRDGGNLLGGNPLQKGHGGIDPGDGDEHQYGKPGIFQDLSDTHKINSSLPAAPGFHKRDLSFFLILPQNLPGHNKNYP